MNIKTTPYKDDFASKGLPPKEYQPTFLLDAPEFSLPDSVNCATYILDKHIQEGRGNNIAIRSFDTTWTYLDLYHKANQIANFLVKQLHFKSGSRVLIRATNNPMHIACWFGIVKAGGIVISSMPLLRA